MFERKVVGLILLLSILLAIGCIMDPKSAEPAIKRGTITSETIAAKYTADVAFLKAQYVEDQLNCYKTYVSQKAERDAQGRGEDLTCLNNAIDSFGKQGKMVQEYCLQGLKQYYKQVGADSGIYPCQSHEFLDDSAAYYISLPT